MRIIKQSIQQCRREAPKVSRKIVVIRRLRLTRYYVVRKQQRITTTCILHRAILKTPVPVRIWPKSWDKKVTPEFQYELVLLIYMHLVVSMKVLRSGQMHQSSSHIQQLGCIRWDSGLQEEKKHQLSSTVCIYIQCGVINHVLKWFFQCTGFHVL